MVLFAQPAAREDAVDHELQLFGRNRLRQVIGRSLAQCLQGATQMQTVKVNVHHYGPEVGWTQGVLAVPQRGRYEFSLDGGVDHRRDGVAQALEERGFVVEACTSMTLIFEWPSGGDSSAAGITVIA